MAIQVAINHKTQYKYDKAVTLGPQVVRLRPAAHCRTPILSYALNVTPARHFIHWQQDQHGNHQARLVFPDKTMEFTVEIDLRAELSSVNPFDFFLEPGFDEYPFEYDTDLKRDLQLFLSSESPGPKVIEFLNSIAREKQGTVAFLTNLNRRVRDAVGYVTRFDPGIQTCEETLERGSGSCRDSSWLLVQLLRQLGFASRFVSGYLIQLASDEEVAAAPIGTSTDSTDLHAWAEVFLPGAGWVGLDPTSGLLTGEGHIPLACTPDAGHAAPISGTVEPSNVEFSYTMGVRRLTQTASSAVPISDEQWNRLNLVAHQVDADLAANDVRLTMGGEPTFVGLDEPDSPQWNIAAMGPLKRERAVALIKGLREKIAPGALLHFGQGKWYPGEPLPRWALNCYWRTDGVAVWENPALIADDKKDYGFQTGDALAFLTALTRRLEGSAANIMPAYEDAIYYAWRERRLPINVDVADTKLNDPREREEFLRVFSNGLGNPVGYVLPIRRRQHEGRVFWSSQLWFLRPKNLFLLQGDSPIGFRLPLDGLPWVAPDDIEYDYETDPFADREKLPSRSSQSHSHLFDQRPPEDPLPPEPVTGDSAKEVVRPALSVEARDGRLHVFLPYTTKLPDYLELLIAIEDTAAHLQTPVWIEGYTPPSDPRLRSFSVTPDPGVIEVNLPPADGWDELVRINTLVFDEAHQIRLTAERFAYDGKHTATGGGNHIVLGGPTAADSPLLRRPGLLRSLIAFWQNHPSLSYLFSGTFIGPTSQYPRVDEARLDSLYELEIAFGELPSADCPPWLVDRLFRNLLVDMTGNTHRAEFCIDKLYPPQGSGSRLGLLELRAFEMSPHVRMELAKLLLIRALVAMFWRKPYEARLVRWGTSLHDRFLLPRFVKQDFMDVLTTLQRFGYALDPAWFQAQVDFRFPKIGSIAVQDIDLELRQALEPWHVLGEEASAGGTVRSVDSSLDRVQVSVNGIEMSRYAVACNGRRVPLHATGKPGEAVAGVRFRAWHPPSCLHPTIPVQSPLVFDILDLWNGESVGGCTYHVVHPGGRWYSARPVNAAEAESRRLERFQNFGHIPGVVTVPDAELNPSFPMTLDLRWPAPDRQSSIGVPALDA
jgi:uncharacterized protein (DUF2126 family)